MSHFQTNGLCCKFQKWMNLKAQSNTHSQGGHNQCSHSHMNSQHNMLLSSPYKKTSFETLLRKYPKNYDQMKQSRLNMQNESKQSVKRTFQNRMAKYDNVKSKIDTNLGNLKGIRLPTPCNDENKNTQNILFQVDQGDKLTYQQKPLVKKIKLNMQNINKFETNKQAIRNENSSFLSNQIMVTNDKQQNGKPMYRINVSKKIYFASYYNKDNQRQLHKQQEDEFEQFLQDIHKNQQNNRIQNDIQQDRQNSQKSAFKQQKIESIGEQKFIFKNLKEKITFKNHDMQDEHSQSEDNDIFAFDGYRIFEQQNQSDGQNQSELQDQQQDQKQLQKQNQPLEQKQIIPQFQQLKLQSPQQQINNVRNQNIVALFQQSSGLKEVSMNIQIINSNDLTPIKLVAELSLPQNTQQAQLSANLIISQVKKNPEQCINDKNIQISNSVIKNQIPKYQNQNIEKQKIKQKRKKLKRQIKKKKLTKILTRSKQQKLNLFNKLSMRLIRKKYGLQLTHQQLADKMLSTQNRHQLKAFLESQSNELTKTIFNFTDLSNNQMKNILVKYFDQEENKANINI